MGRRILLAGVTGLVGKECARLLAADPTVSEIVALSRRDLEAPFEKIRVEVVDFDALATRPELFRVDQIVCALGTTLKKAGSDAAFRRVDYDYPVRIAELGRAHGARHFLLVSAIGSSAKSKTFYYRVKGELEAAVGALGYPSLTIARPSLLLGERDEWRWKEEPLKLFGWLAPARMKPVPAVRVAEALLRAAREDLPGRRVLENAELLQA